MDDDLTHGPKPTSPDQLPEHESDADVAGDATPAASITGGVATDAGTGTPAREDDVDVDDGYDRLRTGPGTSLDPRVTSGGGFTGMPPTGDDVA